MLTKITSHQQSFLTDRNVDDAGIPYLKEQELLPDALLNQWMHDTHVQMKQIEVAAPECVSSYAFADKRPLQLAICYHDSVSQTGDCFRPRAQMTDIANLQSRADNQTLLIYHGAPLPLLDNCSEGDWNAAVRRGMGRRAHFYQLYSAARQVCCEADCLHMFTSGDVQT